MLLISLPITIPLLAVLSFVMSDLILVVGNESTVSFVLLDSLFLLILAMPTYLIYKIYVNKIKKYPETLFVITEQNFHFFLLKNNIIDIYHKFDVPFDKLNGIFYGEINKKTKILGSRFEIRKNNRTLMKGKLNIANNSFVNSSIDSKYLLPIKDLQNIYLE